MLQRAVGLHRISLYEPPRPWVVRPSAEVHQAGFGIVFALSEAVAVSNWG